MSFQTVHSCESEGVAKVAVSTIKSVVSLVDRCRVPANALISSLSSFTETFAIYIVYRVFLK